MSANVFSVGIKWNYKNKDRDNYVEPYYADLKSEIMEYEDIANIKKSFTGKFLKQIL